MKRAFFFDMDGVLFNSMPNHAEAWETVMNRHGLPFTRRDCYLQEGRTGESVIDEYIRRIEGRVPGKDELLSIYKEKTELFHALGGAAPIDGVKEVLDYLLAQNAIIFIVTGSGQQSLFDMLDQHFPGIFVRERMVTAWDVVNGKPDPEPYLKALAKAQAIDPTLQADECVVIENAPLGTRSGHAAGLQVYAVNTGPLTDDDLWQEGATQVFKNMQQLLEFLEND